MPPDASQRYVNLHGASGVRHELIRGLAAPDRLPVADRRAFLRRASLRDRGWDNDPAQH